MISWFCAYTFAVGSTFPTMSTYNCTNKKTINTTCLKNLKPTNTLAIKYKILTIHEIWKFYNSWNFLQEYVAFNFIT